MALGVWLIALVQYYYAVPRLLVKKCTCMFSHEDAVPWHTSTRHLKCARIIRKVHPILRWCPVPNYTFPLPPPPRWRRWVGLAALNSMLPLAMGCEQSERKFNSALRAMYPLLYTLPIRESPPRHFSSVCLRLTCVRGVTRLACHANRIPLVGTETNLVKEVR